MQGRGSLKAFANQGDAAGLINKEGVCDGERAQGAIRHLSSPVSPKRLSPVMSPALPFLPSAEPSEEEEAGGAAANGDLPQGSIDGKQINSDPVGRDLLICGVTWDRMALPFRKYQPVMNPRGRRREGTFLPLWNAVFPHLILPLAYTLL